VEAGTKERAAGLLSTSQSLLLSKPARQNNESLRHNGAYTEALPRRSTWTHQNRLSNHAHAATPASMHNHPPSPATLTGCSRRPSSWAPRHRSAGARPTVGRLSWSTKAGRGASQSAHQDCNPTESTPPATSGSGYEVRRLCAQGCGGAFPWVGVASWKASGSPPGHDSLPFDKVRQLYSILFFFVLSSLSLSTINHYSSVRGAFLPRRPCPAPAPPPGPQSAPPCHGPGPLITISHRPPTRPPGRLTWIDDHRCAIRIAVRPCTTEARRGEGRRISGDRCDLSYRHDHRHG
jgi:hypothetical protein